MKLYTPTIDKQKFLDKHIPFKKKIKLEEKKECIHCGEVFEVKHYKVEEENTSEGKIYFILCPNAPRCSGTIMDWFPVPKNKK